MWQTGMEHTLFLIAVIGFVVGSVKGIRAWRRERVESIAARARHEAALGRVLAQFENNGGSSLLDKVEEGNRVLTSHVDAADGWFKANNEAHKDIHRRIDGMFELLAGPGATQPRKLAQWHAANRAKDEEG